jgi:CDP-paratose 2-epimerase
MSAIMSHRDHVGVCQWFHYEAYDDLERAVSELQALGVTHLRTGISWADYHRPGGPAWYDWQMRRLEEFEVLLSVWHTPPSIAEGGICAGPPRRLADYADFIDEVIDRHGHQFAALELWNEPNNKYKWDFLDKDPQWEKFGAMVAGAARVASERRVQTVLGGMIPVDHLWLERMRAYGALEHIDVIAIHAFPNMWWHWEGAPYWDSASTWRGWDDKLAYIRSYSEGRPIWVTETGLATWDLEHGRPARLEAQVGALEKAAHAPADRVYWYSLIDLDPAREAIEGFHVDENEYHMGLCSHGGHRKPAWSAMRELVRGPRTAQRTMSSPPSTRPKSASDIATISASKSSR